MGSSQFRFEWISTWEDVWSPTFLRQWQKLVESDFNAHVFFTPAVVRAWVETQLAFRSIQPRFMIIREVGELLFLFPLILERASWQGGFVRSLQPVGWNSFDYQTPLVAASLEGRESGLLLAEILKNCQSYLGGEYDIFRIPFLRDDSLPEAAAFPLVDVAPFLNLKGVESLDQITEKLSKGWRQDIRRQRRRLEQAGAVELVTCAPDEVEKARGFLPHLMRFHSERWSYRRNESAIRRIMMLWEKLALYALPEGTLHVAALRCGDEVIACSLSFQFNKRFYFYIPASASKWENYSPGKLLLSMLLEQAIANRFEVFDLLRGNETYKQRWSAKLMPLYGVEERMKGVGPALRTGVQKYVAHMRITAKRVVIGGRSIMKSSK